MEEGAIHPRESGTLRPEEFLKLVQECKGTLELHSVVRFRRRTREHPVGLDEVLEALENSVDITEVVCPPIFTFGLAEAEWDRVVRTFGSMPNLMSLRFVGGVGGFISLPAAFLTDVLQNSQSLTSLELTDKAVITGTDDNTECERLADAIAQSQLVHLVCACLFRGGGNARRLVCDGIRRCKALQSLNIRDHLRHLSPDETVAVLHSLPSLKHLTLYTCHWASLGQTMTAITNPSLETLSVVDHFVNPEPFCNFMKDMQRNTNLRELSLCLIEGFAHDCMKDALYQLILRNKTLRTIRLQDRVPFHPNPSWSPPFGWKDWADLIASQRSNGRIQIQIDDMSEHHSQVASSPARYWRYRNAVEVENILNRCLDLPQLQHSISRKDDLFRVQALFGFFKRNPSCFNSLVE